MHAIAEVRVQMGGLAEHHRVSRRATTECVRTRILADAPVCLELRQADRDATVGSIEREHATEQERRECNRILLEEPPVGDDQPGQLRPCGSADTR